MVSVSYGGRDLGGQTASAMEESGTETFLDKNEHSLMTPFATGNIVSRPRLLPWPGARPPSGGLSR